VDGQLGIFDGLWLSNCQWLIIAVWVTAYRFQLNSVVMPFEEQRENSILMRDEVKSFQVTFNQYRSQLKQTWPTSTLNF